MAWLQFVVSSVIVVVAAVFLARYSDVIAVRTRLGGLFIGTLLLAGSTSLPEVLAAINALAQDAPNLAAGSMFGSTMFNMFVLALLDLLNQQARILRRIAMTHALTASLANLMAGLAVFFILADVPTQLGWVGADSLLIVGIYVGGIRLIQGRGGPPGPAAANAARVPSLRRAMAGFAISTLVLVLTTPTLVRSAAQIAAQTGLSTGFIGATLLAFATSLPEVVSTVAATRVGAYDLAVGNLFGSNLFNMFALGLTDAFYLPGRFLGVVDPTLALAGLIGLLLTALGLIGNLARVERRLLFVEADALLILIGYFAGMWYLYVHGIGV